MTIPNKILTILKKCISETTQIEVADKYNINQQVISRILKEGKCSPVNFNKLIQFIKDHNKATKTLIEQLDQE